MSLSFPVAPSTTPWSCALSSRSYWNSLFVDKETEAQRRHREFAQNCMASEWSTLDLFNSETFAQCLRQATRWRRGRLLKHRVVGG